MVDAGNPGGFIGFLTQNLTPEDIEAIARRVVEIIGERLAKPAAGQVRAAAESPQTVAPEKLAYSRKDLCEALGLSSATLWRLEALGRIRPVVGVRHKIYSRKEVERFLDNSRSRSAGSRLLPARGASPRVRSP